jgi:hypothetical protein
MLTNHVANSGYSAHEHSSLTSSSLTPATLPTDILLEALLSTVIMCVGIVLHLSSTETSQLRPIAWHTWNGKQEREKGAGAFPFLEERVGFLDIRVSGIKPALSGWGF